MTRDGALECQFCLEFAGEPEALWPQLAPSLPPDRTLHAERGFRIIPPLGQFVEGALMIVSETHVSSCASLHPDQLADLELLMQRTHAVLAREYRAPIFFEHGPANSTKGTCCVDHAHMHAFPVDVEVHSFLAERYPGREIASLDELRAVAHGTGGYLFLQQGSRRWAYTCELVPSQLIRQVIAARLGISERWHWRTHLGLEELARTFERLRGAWERA